MIEITSDADQLPKFKDRLPKEDCIILVKSEKKGLRKAYFYQDKAVWLGFYGFTTSHFQDFETNEFLYDVTQWEEMK